MVGSAIHRRLSREGYKNFLLKNSAELDPRDQQAVAAFFATEKPDFVFLAATSANSEATKKALSPMKKRTRKIRNISSIVIDYI